MKKESIYETLHQILSANIKHSWFPASKLKKELRNKLTTKQFAHVSNTGCVIRENGLRYIIAYEIREMYNLSRATTKLFVYAEWFRNWHTVKETMQQFDETYPQVAHWIEHNTQLIQKKKSKPTMYKINSDITELIEKYDALFVILPQFKEETQQRRKKMLYGDTSQQTPL